MTIKLSEDLEVGMALDDVDLKQKQNLLKMNIEMKKKHAVRDLSINILISI